MSISKCEQAELEWLIVGLLVLGRIIAASWSNVLQKRSISLGNGSEVNPSPLELQFAVWGCMALVLAPWWSGSLSKIMVAPANALWLWMAVACMFEAPGNFLLLRSLQRTDLSIFGPLASYKPLLGMLLGWLILNEAPSQLGFVGTCILISGTFVLGNRSASESSLPPRTRHFAAFTLTHPGVRDRLSGVALTAAGAVFMKLGMAGTNSLTALAVWSLIGWCLTALWILGHNRSVTQSLGKCFQLLKLGQVWWIATMLAMMQGLTILVFQRIPVGYALALFQLGSILTVYLGHQLFGERELWRRLLAAAIMVSGAMLILLG